MKKPNGHAPHAKRKRLSEPHDPYLPDLFPHGVLPYVEEKIAQTVEGQLNVKLLKVPKKPFREYDGEGMIHPKMTKKCHDAEKLHKARGGHK